MKEQTFCHWTTLGKKSSSMYPTFFACVSEWLQLPIKISVSLSKWRCQQKDKYNVHGYVVMSDLVSWAYLKHLEVFITADPSLQKSQAVLRYTNPMYEKQLTGQPWITCTVDLATLFDQVTGPGFLKGRVLCFTFNTLFKNLFWICNIWHYDH